MNIQSVQKRLREFAAAREWQLFHSPKNLAMALMVEAAELLELFQWLTTEQSHTLTRVPADKEKVADEIADVMLYLLQIADCTGVDLEAAVEQKIVKNAAKYPAKFPEVLNARPKVHLLVDWENVQPDAAALKRLEPEGTDVWLFHAPAQRMDAEKHKKAYGSNSVTLVERTGAGKNALDFQLSYYAGYLMARQPEARFVVVSNDKGYDPMLEHACKLEFDAKRRNYQKPAAASKLSVIAQSEPAPMCQRVKGTTEKLPPAKPFAASLSVAQLACRTRTALYQLPPLRRPVDWNGLLEMVQMQIAGDVPNEDSLVEKVCRLLQLRGTVMLDRATGHVQYRFVEAQSAAVIYAPDQSVATAVANVATSVTATSQVSDVTPLIQHSEVTKPVSKAPAKAQGKQLPASTAKKQVVQVAHKVKASLQKMTESRPKTRDGLLKIVVSHLSPKFPEAVTAEKVCAVLQSMQAVKISRQGQVTYPAQEVKAAKPKTPAKKSSASPKRLATPKSKQVKIPAKQSKAATAKSPVGMKKIPKRVETGAAAP